MSPFQIRILCCFMLFFANFYCKKRNYNDYDAEIYFLQAHDVQGNNCTVTPMIQKGTTESQNSYFKVTCKMIDGKLYDSAGIDAVQPDGSKRLKTISLLDRLISEANKGDSNFIAFLNSSADINPLSITNPKSPQTWTLQKLKDMGGVTLFLEDMAVRVGGTVRSQIYSWPFIGAKK